MAEFSPHSGFIKEGAHILPVRVYYEDTDAGGVVYYANYLKYIERGRSDMLRILGINQGMMLRFKQPDDVKFVVGRVEVDYVKSAHLDDALLVYSRISKIGGARLVIEQEIRRDGEILTKAIVRIVVLNKDDKPVRLWEKLMGKLTTVIKE